MTDQVAGQFSRPRPQAGWPRSAARLAAGPL